MYTLTLIRHAKSSWADPLLEDKQRPLNQRGLKNATKAGAYLKAQDWQIESIFSSDALRALQTAELINQHLNLPIDKYEELYSFNMYNIKAFIQKTDNRLKSIAVVSHNPALTDLLNTLCGETSNNMPTCSIAHIQMDINNWCELDLAEADLVHFYTPKKNIL